MEAYYIAKFLRTNTKHTPIVVPSGAMLAHATSDR